MSCPCRIQKKLIRSRYEHNSNKEVYLDYNATTPPDRELLALYQNLSLKTWGNPFSPHGAGSEAYKMGESAKKILRMSLRKDDDTLFFYSSGTEALFRGLQFFKRMSNRIGNIHVYPSILCHPSVFEALDFLNLPYIKVPVDSDGRMKLAELKITERPLIVYSPVNHETGGIENCANIRSFADEHNGFIFADGVQAFVRLKEDQWLPYCDIYCMSGHKFHVPRGISLLGINPEICDNLKLEDDMKESENSIMQYTLARGIEEYQAIRDSLNQQLIIQEKDALYLWKKNDLLFNVESPSCKVPGILNISLPDLENMEDLFVFLAKKNICISRFCACSGTVEGVSPILSHMGVPPERASRSLRLSAGKYTTRQDWIILGKALKEYIDS